MVADGDGGCGSGLIGLIWVGVEVWRFGLIGADLGMCDDGGWVVMVAVGL